MKKFICIHGHFYQPPRENPWLEAITYQESAHPFHDWNERVHAECYAPNSQARIVDGKGDITDLVNNYSQISFDFGPTLLSWMEACAPNTYQALLNADKLSQKQFSQHGSAMAQCYSHMIMPLANKNDKYTQVYWGIRDFEFRFQRLPEGMWLPETAVDLDTLEIMADLGIKFTVLAPHQARLLMHNNATGQEFDIHKPYRIQLESGRVINVFFYNGPLSQSLAFENLLKDGKQYAEKLIHSFSGNTAEPQLLSVATDGETYGHHHKFGDMALAYTLRYIDNHPDACLTNYAEFLDNFPPKNEIQIIEKTSWSCAHGIERWKSDCGCETGGQPSWNQEWRQPLRAALDWLKGQADSIFTEVSRNRFKKPWHARNNYINCFNGQLNIDSFLAEQSGYDMKESEKIVALKLLQMQRHAMLMYTSCGWFFNDISGIETEQILSYAGRVIQLAEELSSKKLEPKFLTLLALAKSNVPERENGAQIYKQVIKKSRMNFSTLCAHYALNRLIDLCDNKETLYSNRIELLDFHNLINHRSRMIYGTAKITSNLTLDSSQQDFCAYHFGDYKIKVFAKYSIGQEAFENAMEPVPVKFITGSSDEVLTELESIFEKKCFPLNTMSKNEQKSICDAILYSAMSENDESYSRLYDSFEPLSRYFMEQGLTPPKSALTLIESILNVRLWKEVQKEEPEFHLIEKLLSEVDLHGVSLEAETLGKFIEKGVHKMAHRIVDDPDNLSMLESFETIIRLLTSMPLQFDLWQVQSLIYQVKCSNYDEVNERSQQGDGFSKKWISRFNALAHSLHIQVPQ